MTNIGYEGTVISQDTNTRIVELQSEISRRKQSLPRYQQLTNLLTKSDQVINIGQLIELRNYLGSELLRLGESQLQKSTNLLTTTFGFDIGAISQEIESIRQQILTKMGALIDMTSIGFPHSIGASGPIQALEELAPPKLFQQRGIHLPVDQTWKEVYALIEFVGLLIVEKELIAEKMILKYQADITGRQSQILGLK